MKSDYANAFRIIRAAFGLKQYELAERMPISASRLSSIEAGKRQPSIRIVDCLADAVGVPSALISLLASEAEEMEKRPTPIFPTWRVHYYSFLCRLRRIHNKFWN